MTRRGYLDHDWGQTHYHAAGGRDAPLLLLLHQSPLSSRNYHALLPILGQRFQAVALDTPGFGASDPVPGRWEVEDYAAWAVQCADRLGAQRLYLFGRATGAVFAAEAARLWPDRIRRLILHGMPVYSAEERSDRLTGFAPPYVIDDAGGHLGWIWSRIHSEYPWIDAELANHFLKDFLAAGSDFATAYRSIWRYDLPAKLAEGLDCPSLLIGGGRDRIGFMHERAVRLLPDAESILLEDATDFAAEQIPERFAQILFDFLPG